jgi:hypothetical protein
MECWNKAKMDDFLLKTTFQYSAMTLIHIHDGYSSLKALMFLMDC